MKKRLRTINGKLYGCFYELDAGRLIFLAHMTPSKVLHSRSGAFICINEGVLRECKKQGIKFIGAVIREGSRKVFYATKLDDFYSTRASQHVGTTSLDRKFPARLFMVTPDSSTKTIADRALIRR